MDDGFGTVFLNGRLQAGQVEHVAESPDETVFEMAVDRVAYSVGLAAHEDDRRDLALDERADNPGADHAGAAGDEHPVHSAIGVVREGLKFKSGEIITSTTLGAVSARAL